MDQRSVLLILAALVGSSTQFTVAVDVDVREQERASEKSETESYTKILCSPIPSSSSATVHTLRPADISALHALGMPLSHRHEVVKRVAELLSMFNPEVITQQVDKTSLQPRSLLEEAEKLSLSISHQEMKNWKLVLLFVPWESLCACSPDVAADVKDVVQEVEAALQLLQKKLHHTLVHVVVWSSNKQQDGRCECMKDKSINQRLHKATLLKTLQDTLSNVLKNPKWHSEKVDFAAVLQSAPVILDTENKQSESERLALQLWTNLLLLSTGQPEVMDNSLISIPCPTQQPFLRTQANSPPESEGKSSTLADLVMGTEVPCTDRNPSNTTPTSVHELRPGDIKVVAAVGDSLTAANGVGARVDSIVLLLHQYRGLSWSIGGDENITTVTTLPNILREFNPSLTGFSEGIGSEDSPNAFLNQAVPGAQSGDMVQQVRTLVGKMKNDTRIDFHNDWKVITMFVGGNDICDFCNDEIVFSPSNVASHIQQALDILHNEVPRAIVNLVEMLHIVPLRDLHSDNSLGCPTWLVRLLCPCVLSPEEGSVDLQKVNDLNKAYQHAMRELVDSGRYDTHNNFTVVLQPFMREIYLPRLEDGRPDRSFFAPDCFHLSQKTHTLMAQALWNNMLEPVGNKTFKQDFEYGIDLKCPSESNPFFRTAVNSNFTFPGPPPTPAPSTVMGTEVPCTDRNPSNTTPTSVHELRPGDIKVVAAVGDSLTAANGVGARVDDLVLMLHQYRGLSWSIGGDENITTVTTLPNILREFNPSLTGFSEGIGSEDSPNAFLNQAVPGAQSGDMVQQVRTLVGKMKNDTRIDFHNDWKVITMFVGGNDICHFCSDEIFFSPSNVASHIQQALDILHNEVPRAIVNLVEMLHIVPLRDLHSDNSLGCPTWFVSFLCPCVLSPEEGSVDLQKVNDLNKAYQHAMRELVDSGRYDTHNNFTVVLQPFMREIYLPRLEDGRPDRSFFAPDCFHLSQKTHTLMARALWNNMLEPVGNKTFKQDFEYGIDLKCPSESNPFFRTAVNSNFTFPGPPPTPAPSTNWGSDFSCMNTAPSSSVPTSAHRLRPADFKVVAALGDSITTGFGAKAKNLQQLPTEYKGVSWSIGGDETLTTVTTLPNILKKFNSDIKGMSMGQGNSQSGFNMAVSGAKISGIPEQVRRLIDAMKNDITVDFENDWKLVTLFIGGNDLCQYCNDRVSLSPQNYSHHMMTSLDMLYKEVPRTFVNILEILEIEGLRRIKKDSLGCSALHQYVCSCFLLVGEDSLELAEMKRVNRELQDETERLVYGGRYDDREDFAVVVQPFFRNTVVPLNEESKPDTTYFSEDCFHFSDLGHACMAAALWRNMLEPVGKKQTYNNFTKARETIKCPTEEHPYIFTKVNSFPISEPTYTSNVPAWLGAVLAVAGLLTGSGVTWLLLSCIAKRNKRLKTSTVEMNGSTF